MTKNMNSSSRKMEQHRPFSQRIVLEPMSPHHVVQDIQDSADLDFSLRVFKKQSPKNINISDNRENNRDKTEDISRTRTQSRIKNLYCSLIITVTSLKIVQKIQFFLSNIIFVHALVILITCTMISIQSYVGKFCWYFDFCICESNFQIKIYASIYYILVFFNLIILIFYKAGVEIIFLKSETKVFGPFIFYCINFLVIFSLLLVLPEKDTYASYLIGLMYAVLLTFQMKFFRDVNYKIRPWLIYLLKVNSIPALFFSHYLLSLLVFPKISNFFVSYFGSYIGKNLTSFTITFFFFTYSSILPKLCCVYHNYVRSLGVNDMFPTIVVIRFTLAFCIIMPLSNIINISIEDWGSWILFLSYVHFLITGYTRCSIGSYFLERVVKKFCPKKRIANIFDSNSDLECKQLISGCLIDVVFIVNFRLIFIVHFKKWLQVAAYVKYYKNCEFEISDEFIVSLHGIYSIVVVNNVITFGLLGYMIITKKRLFEYIVTKNHISNVVLLFGLHGLFDAYLQLCYNILQEL